MAQILVARMLRPVWHWWNLMSFPTCSFPLLFLAGNSTQVPWKNRFRPKIWSRSLQGSSGGQRWRPTWGWFARWGGSLHWHEWGKRHRCHQQLDPLWGAGHKQWGLGGDPPEDHLRGEEDYDHGQAAGLCYLKPRCPIVHGIQDCLAEGDSAGEEWEDKKAPLVVHSQLFSFRETSKAPGCGQDIWGKNENNQEKVIKQLPERSATKPQEIRWWAFLLIVHFHPGLSQCHFLVEIEQSGSIFVLWFTKRQRWYFLTIRGFHCQGFSS